MWRTQCVLGLVAVCVGLARSWDVAVGQGDQVVFYTNGIKTKTVTIKYQNITALAYDEVRNMMLYVDKQKNSDFICGYRLSSEQNTCYVQRIRGNIHDLAFDPATDLLFFTDTNERSINSFSVKSLNADVNHLIPIDDRIPNNIAVDSCRGYIYWSTTDAMNKCHLERARLDGSKREVLYRYAYNTETALTDLAIDPHTQKMYYSERFKFSAEDYYYMNVADLNGHNEKIIFVSIFPLNHVVVSKDYIYWVNSTENHIYQTIWQIPKDNLSFLREEISDFHDARSVSIVTNYRTKDQSRGLQDCERISIETEYTTEIDQTTVMEQTTETDLIIETDQTTESEKTKYTDLIIETDYTTESDKTKYTDLIIETDQTTESDKTKYTDLIIETDYTTESEEIDTDHHTENLICVHGVKVSYTSIYKCTPGYIGGLCDISVCENYCVQGNCRFNDEGVPTCRCNAGYSGQRCEVNVCYNYCLNNGDCSLNEEDEPICQCVGNHEGSRCEAVKNDTSTNTPTHHSAERNLTLADILSRWRKPTAKISVIVEV